MLQFLGARLLEAEDLAALGIDAGHDMLDGPVLSRRVHGLENQEQGVAVVGVKEALEGPELLNVFLEDFFVLFFGAVKGFQEGRPLLEMDGFPFLDTKRLGMNFHF